MQALDDGQGDKMEEASKAGLFAPSYICPGYLRPRSKEINDHDISLNVSLSYEKKQKKNKGEVPPPRASLFQSWRRFRHKTDKD